MSRRFIVIAAILIIVILAGLSVILSIATKPIVTDESGFRPHESTSIVLTNQFVGSAIAGTATSRVFTSTPKP